MNHIVINGFSVKGGSNICISNGRVIVDGLDVTPDAKTKNQNITIVVHGNVDHLEASNAYSIDIKGAVHGNVETVSGDVQCGDIQGSVRTVSGDVRSGTVGGSVETLSGDISCQKIKK